jgi:membrane protease YdiL (CAAX protease family)
MTTKQDNKNMSLDEKRVYIFYGITFGLAYLIVLVLYLNGGLLSETELFPDIRLVTVLTTLYLALPTIGHLLTRLITKEGWRHLFLAPKLGRGWRYWLLAWLGIPVLIAIGGAVFYLFFPDFFDSELGHVAVGVLNQGIALENLAVPLSTILLRQIAVGIFQAPIFNLPTSLASEFGWRAYLQPKLMELGPRKALLITGASWGLFLAPLVSLGYTYGYFDIDYWGAPLSGMLMIILAATYLGVVLGWLTYRGGSVWPAVIGYGMVTGVAEIALLVSKGVPPLLLGPTVNGILGGAGFIIAAVLILRFDNGSSTSRRRGTAWKTPKETQDPFEEKDKRKSRRSRRR